MLIKIVQFSVWYNAEKIKNGWTRVRELELAHFQKHEKPKYLRINGKNCR